MQAELEMHGNTSGSPEIAAGMQGNASASQAVRAEVPGVASEAAHALFFFRSLHFTNGDRI